jgi:hypothetical protein
MWGMVGLRFAAFRSFTQASVSRASAVCARLELSVSLGNSQTLHGSSIYLVGAFFC